MIGRRRFLMITAAAVTAPAAAQSNAVWTSKALGADVQVTIRGVSEAGAIFDGIARDLLAVERQFNLYDPTSQLSQLNQTGRLIDPAPDFVSLMRAADRLNALTGGLFDPTIQPLWQALAIGGDPANARALIGWDKVQISPDIVRLAPGQAMTLNGIAQGFATDLVAQRLRQAGLGDVLVNIGEFSANGGPWHLAVYDPDEGEIARVAVQDAAIATSSPRAFPGFEHILNPARNRPAEWSTISVVAKTATIADGASTAFCLMPQPDIQTALNTSPDILEVHLLGREGRYRRLRA